MAEKIIKFELLIQSVCADKGKYKIFLLLKFNFKECKGRNSTSFHIWTREINFIRIYSYLYRTHIFRLIYTKQRMYTSFPRSK